MSSEIADGARWIGKISKVIEETINSAPSVKFPCEREVVQLLRLLLAVGLFVSTVVPAVAGQIISNDLTDCQGDDPAVLATVQGIKGAQGMMRVQSYRATKGEWLKKGRWLKRIEQPARAGRMRFCIPMDAPGIYAIAVRHDRNGNGKTDIMSDGGGMSNNPSISIWNLGKPSYKKVRIPVVRVTPIVIKIRYM